MQKAFDNIKSLCAAASFLKTQQFSTRATLINYFNQLNNVISLQSALKTHASEDTSLKLSQCHYDAKKSVASGRYTANELAQHKATFAQLKFELEHALISATIEAIKKTIQFYRISSAITGPKGGKETFNTSFAATAKQTPQSKNSSLPQLPRFGCLMYLVLDAAHAQNVAKAQINTFFHTFANRVANRRRADINQQDASFVFQGMLLCAKSIKNHSTFPLKPRLENGTWYNYPFSNTGKPIPRHEKTADILLAAQILFRYQDVWEEFDAAGKDGFNLLTSKKLAEFQAWTLINQPMWRSFQRKHQNTSKPARKKRRVFDKSVCVAVAKPAHGPFGIDKAALLDLIVPEKQPEHNSLLAVLFNAVSKAAIASSATWANENMVQSFYAPYITEITQEYTKRTMNSAKRAQIATTALQTFLGAFASEKMIERWKKAMQTHPAKLMKSALLLYYNQLQPHKKKISLSVRSTAEKKTALTFLLCLNRSNVNKDKKNMVVHKKTHLFSKEVLTQTGVQLACPRSGIAPESFMQLEDTLCFDKCQIATVMQVRPLILAPVLSKSFSQGTPVQRVSKHPIADTCVLPTMPEEIVDAIMFLAFPTPNYMWEPLTAVLTNKWTI